MIDTSKTITRHSSESEILRLALDGDSKAADKFLTYLSSDNPHLRQIMKEAIHDLHDERIWQYLLYSLALHRWNDCIDCNRRSEHGASERIDQAIIEVFTTDEADWEKPVKDMVLTQALEDPAPRIRSASSCILGLRGDLRAIPALAETAESANEEWQLRAVKALTALKDERCGPPLFTLLATSRGELHKQAGRALLGLGELAKSTWLAGLNHPDSHIRWHSARGLGEIGEAGYAKILAEGLRDKSYVVRWASADVLAQLGAEAVPATISMLTHHQLDEQFRQAVFHALNGINSHLVKERIKPLLDALRGPAASIEAPMLAQHLLAEWMKDEQ
jgi:HEAT repeat protein